MYTSSFSSVPRLAPYVSRWQASLTIEEKRNIGRDVSEDEIKVALRSLKVYKALGPDGLHASFFHKFWLIVGNSVVNVVKKVFVEEEKKFLSTSIKPTLPSSQKSKARKP